MADATLIFLHIPKTAGKTLASVAKRHFRPKHVHQLNLYETIDAIKRLKALPEVERRQIKLLSGHAWYGVHQLLPQPARYFTLLRHPLDRAISAYNFVRSAGDSTLLAPRWRDGMTLAEFVTEQVFDLDNVQTRYVAGEMSEAVSAETLERALRNADTHFDVIGLTEQFDLTLKQMAKRYGWRRLRYKRQLVSPNYVTKETISDADRAAIATTFAIDLDFYAIIAEQFNAKHHDPT